MSRPMSYEPDNGPEIVIPDSDTYTPADSEKPFPGCPQKDTICKFFGMTRKCKCTGNAKWQSIPTPDSDTYTPADGDWPQCKGTVECNCHSVRSCDGFKRKCRCRKSIPTLELLQENPILPDSEGTVVCILVGVIVILVNMWQFRHKGTMVTWTDYFFFIFLGLTPAQSGCLATVRKQVW